MAQFYLKNPGYKIKTQNRDTGRKTQVSKYS